MLKYTMMIYDAQDIDHRPTSISKSFHDKYEENYKITDTIVGQPEDPDSQSRIVGFDPDAVNQLFLQEAEETQVLQRLRNSFGEEYDFNTISPIEIHDDGSLSYTIPLNNESIVNVNLQFNGTGVLRDTIDAIRSASKEDVKLLQALRSRISIDINNKKPVINFFIK